jgi:hypothetical protein
VREERGIDERVEGYSIGERGTGKRIEGRGK